MRVVCYGMGIDSTALLVKMVQEGDRPDYILTADTGAEKPGTYEYLPIMNQFLAQAGFPEITLVRYEVTDYKGNVPYTTLEQECLVRGGLPSIAFGFHMKTCSQKWKAGPQHAWLKQQAAVQALWKTGAPVTVEDTRILKYIGYDNSPQDRKRTYHANNENDTHYRFRYPLIEWGWDRTRCTEEIRKAGLPVPLKSACFFCPASKTHEIDALSPHLLRRIILMEARAQPRLRSIQGLWANGSKGTRGGEKKPGAMTQYIANRQLLPAHEIDWLWSHGPQAITERDAAYRRGEPILNWTDFFADLDTRCQQLPLAA